MKKTFLSAILLLVICGFTQAQITDFEARTFINNSGDTLNYRLLKPAKYDSTKSYPLVVFLHGAGERGSDNYSQLKWGAPHFADPTMREKYPAFVVAPQVPENQYWSSLKSVRDTSSFTQPMPAEPSPPMKLTIELLDSLQNNYPINAKRLYVTGLSMGGFGTFDLIQRYPNRFAAAVPICGGGDITRAFLLKDTPLWVFHGSQDEVVDPRFSREMVDAVQLAGGSPGYTEYPDEGHIGAWVQAYRNPHLYEWMFSKELGSEE